MTQCVWKRAFQFGLLQNMNNTPFQLISTGSVNKQWRQSITFRFCAAELWSQWKHTVATLCPPRSPVTSALQRDPGGAQPAVICQRSPQSLSEL